MSARVPAVPQATGLQESTGELRQMLRPTGAQSVFSWASCMLGCVTKSLGGQQFEGNYCAPLLVAGSNAEYNGECQDLHVMEE